MTAKEQIALSNYAQQKSIANMVVDLGNHLSYGKNILDLRYRIRQCRQLQKLFTVEYGKGEASSLDLLQGIVNIINTLINDYRLKGTVVVSEVNALPIPLKNTTIVIASTELTNGPSVPSTYFIKVHPWDINNNLYLNPVLTGIDFVLQISTGGFLHEGDDYTYSPLGGFELINGVTITGNQFILVTVLQGTYIPLTPVEDDSESFPFLLPHVLS